MRQPSLKRIGATVQVSSSVLEKGIIKDHVGIFAALLSILKPTI